MYDLGFMIYDLEIRNPIVGLGDTEYFVESQWQHLHRFSGRHALNAHANAQVASDSENHKSYIINHK